MATTGSYFYHDSYFRRFCSVYKLTLLLLIFDLWFVTSKLQWLQQQNSSIKPVVLKRPVFLSPRYGKPTAQQQLSNTKTRNTFLT